MAASKADFLADILERARQSGATAADVMLVDSSSSAVTVREAALERVESSASADLGLRVLVGQQQALVSCSYSPRISVQDLVDRAVAMAKLAPPDPYAGLADPAQALSGAHHAEAADRTEIGEEQLQSWASVAEAAAQGISGVTKTEGAEASRSQAEIYLLNSAGFFGRYDQSSFAISVSAIAGEGLNMERDYDYTSAVFAADLQNAATVGRSAGEKAVRRLQPRKIKTVQAPVVFDPRIASGVLRYLASAINGATIARGTSFLKNALGEQIFKSDINIIDDPHRVRGLRTRPFDGEGVATVKRHFIDHGRLTGWVLDARSARQLGMQSTGHAARSVGSAPSPSVSNFYLEPGTISRDELLRQIGNGFYVTETMGMGVNLVTGDYSQGASGFWIEDGQIAYPVSELTIAGHLRDMFAQLTPADDLSFRYGIDSPTISVGTMTVAGQ
jgi:PmbA protein